MSAPSLRKATRVHGRTLVLRDAATADAAFIVGLRTDPAKARHLSTTSPQLDEQVRWLERYGAARDQAYFIVEQGDGTPLGTVRLYDPRDRSFCWGSWILRDGAPPAAAIESALMVYAYALDVLGFDSAHFEVRRENARVRAFHERFGATAVDVRGDDVQYELAAAPLRDALRRYRRHLPDGVRVDGLADPVPLP